MKIAIGAKGKNLESEISDVFGRCPYFIILEIENHKIEKTEVIENQNINQVSAAGVSSAQLMAEKDIDIVIAKNIGPRAMDVLKQFDIDIYLGEGLVKNVLQEFMGGKLKET